MLGLFATFSAATAWLGFAEGATLGATVYAVGKGISKK